MSLCPLSWKNIKRINRRYGRRFVQVSAHHSGVLLAVDANGGTWWIDRRTDTITEADEPTTTASRVRSGHLDDEWGKELAHRIAEV